MIKVDHAGENGAVNIYRAQHLISRLRARTLLPELKHFQEHEESHRAKFAEHLERIGVRRCVSYHLCGIGGYGLGLVTGLIGPSAVMATTYAVENVVLSHLEEQSEYLKVHDTDAFDCVQFIIEDEQAHHDHAHSQMDQDSILSNVLVQIVKLCTQAVIKFGMR